MEYTNKKIESQPELEPEPPGPSVIICSSKKMNTSFAFVALQIFIKKIKKYIVRTIQICTND